MANNKFKIRSVKEKSDTAKLVKDINELLEVLAPGVERIDAKRIKELVKNPFFDLYLLEIGKEMAGMASLHYIETLAKKSAWIEDVVVHPRHQGKGFGKEIMEHVVREAKKRNVKHVDLTSSPHRIAANNLYKKLKFEPRKTNVYRLKFKKYKKPRRHVGAFFEIYFPIFFIIFTSRDFFLAAVFLAITPTLAALSSVFWTDGNIFLASSVFPDFASSCSFFTASLKVFLILRFWVARLVEARRYFLADCFIGTFVSLKCKVQS